MNSVTILKKELKALENPEKIIIYKRFFKTAPGQYGYGDKFYGIPVPVMRKILKKYLNISQEGLVELLQSAYHEERFIALQILVENFKNANDLKKENIFDFYINHVKFINNWDLVDTSAPQIVGAYLYDKPRDVLYEFSKSNDLWKKRISVLSTFYFIRKTDFQTTLEISENLLADSHDLIHKAVGWMIREVANRNMEIAEEFLNKYAGVMPRTMLRYAIEKFPEEKRLKYLNLKKSG
jgi:3-methyladenine DNA glycosylase AlkD